MDNYIVYVLNRRVLSQSDKAKYWRNQFNKANNPKEFWSTVRKFKGPLTTLKMKALF